VKYLHFFDRREGMGGVKVGRESDSEKEKESLCKCDCECVCM